MTAKQYLLQIRQLDNLIEQKTNELNKMRETVTGMHGIDYSADRVQHSATSNGMDAVDRMVDDTRKLQNDIASLVGQRKKIIRQIQTMENATYSALLYKRYVQTMKLDEIAKSMDYTEDYIRKLHGKALMAFKNEGGQKKKAHKGTF